MRPDPLVAILLAATLGAPMTWAIDAAPDPPRAVPGAAGLPAGPCAPRRPAGRASTSRSWWTSTGTP